MRSDSKVLALRALARRGLRRALIGGAAPFLAGAGVVAAYMVGVPVRGPLDWAVTTMVLLPAVLVHCHNRAERQGLTVLEQTVVMLLAGFVAYGLSLVGVFVGAATTAGLVLAHQTGVLAAAGSVGSVACALAACWPRLRLATASS